MIGAAVRGVALAQISGAVAEGAAVVQMKTRAVSESAYPIADSGSSGLLHSRLIDRTSIAR